MKKVKKDMKNQKDNSKEKKENISIQDLWRWIKQLIEEVDELSIEKERYEEIYNRESNDIYKNFCEKLIQEFGLNSFDELKFFINDLMTKSDINKEREEIHWSDYDDDDEDELEDKAEIEAKKETIVEVKKEEKKKEGLKDILNNKKTYNNQKYI